MVKKGEWNEFVVTCSLESDVNLTQCQLFAQSLLLLAMLMVFQISAHWIILSEER